LLARIPQQFRAMRGHLPQKNKVESTLLPVTTPYLFGPRASPVGIDYRECRLKSGGAHA
jgi:hypothetical protein